MVRVISVVTLAALLLSGCARVSESRLNPFNWFGGNRGGDAQIVDPADIRPLVPADRVVQVVDGRPLVAQITQVDLTPTSDGIIVRASGIATAAGAYSGELTTASVGDGTIALDFRAFQGGGAGDGTITVARFLSFGELGNTRTITVRSASNAVTRRR